MATNVTSSNLTLYHAVPSRSCQVLWAIKELGLPVKIIDKNFFKDRDILKTAEYKQVNPISKVPALMDDPDVAVQESSAAILYLLDRYGDGKLQPPAGDWAAHGKLLQWLMFAEAELIVNLGRYFWHCIQLPEEQRRPQIGENGKSRAMAAFAILEKELQGKQFLVNDSFSAADITNGYAVNFLKMVGLNDNFPNCTNYLERVSQRDAFKQAFETPEP